MQGLSSKEAELLKDGHNLDKSYNRIRQEYLAKFADRLVGEGEIPSSSVVPCSGSESQPKMETDPAPSLLGLHKFHMFKIGMLLESVARKIFFLICYVF